MNLPRKRSIRRQAFHLLEVLLASALLVVITLPLSALTVQSTRVTHFSRQRLALVARAQHHQSRLQEMAFPSLEVRGDQGPAPFPWEVGADEDSELLPESLEEALSVEEVRPGLLRVRILLTWSVEGRSTPRILELQVLRSRSTLSLEARFPRDEEIS